MEKHQKPIIIRTLQTTLLKTQRNIHTNPYLAEDAAQFI
jgi:hypothetical protein